MDVFFFDKSRSLITRRINTYFKVVGNVTGRKLTSHSARVTMITNSIAQEGITAAQKLAGHRNLENTARYDRNKMTAEEQELLYEKIVPPAPVKIIKRGRPRKSLAEPSSLSVGLSTSLVSLPGSVLADPDSLMFEAKFKDIVTDS